MQLARVGNMNERRGEFGRPEEEYSRGFDYDNQRYYPSDVPRTYHGEEHRGYHPENAQFGNMRRNGPPRREEGYQYYRGAREEPQPGGRQMEFREDRDHFRRKGAFPPQRDRSPLKRDVPHSPHSRSGSSVSSRSYSPDKGKSYTYPNQQKKNKERPPSHPGSGSRDASPQSSASTSKEEPRGLEAEPEEVAPPVRHEPAAVTTTEDFLERRSQAIAAKAREIEQVFRHDCETFGMVVKMLVAKEPSLESQLQSPLRENLGEIQQRCLDDLRHFICELDEVLHPETSS